MFIFITLLIAFVRKQQFTTFYCIKMNYVIFFIKATIACKSSEECAPVLMVNCAINSCPLKGSVPH